MLSYLKELFLARQNLAPKRRKGHQIGPGKRSIISMHRRMGQNRYSPAVVRRLGAERGVGRPVHLG